MSVTPDRSRSPAAHSVSIGGAAAFGKAFALQPCRITFARRDVLPPRALPLPAPAPLPAPVPAPAEVYDDDHDVKEALAGPALAPGHNGITGTAAQAEDPPRHRFPRKTISLVHHHRRQSPPVKTRRKPYQDLRPSRTPSTRKATGSRTTRGCSSSGQTRLLAPAPVTRFLTSTIGGTRTTMTPSLICITSMHSGHWNHCGRQRPRPLHDSLTAQAPQLVKHTPAPLLA